MKVPTDDGMCCAFNRKTADKIFVDSAYSIKLKFLNDEDKGLTFDRPVITPGKYYCQFKKAVFTCVSNHKYFLFALSQRS